MTDDDLITTGKIARAHLNGFPDYYTGLGLMEEQAKREHEGPFPNGSPARALAPRGLQ